MSRTVAILRSRNPLSTLDSAFSSLQSYSTWRCPWSRINYARFKEIDHSEADLTRIFTSVKDILEEARFWRVRGVPELHWGDQIVSLLLNLVQRMACSRSEVTEWKPLAVTLNV